MTQHPGYILILLIQEMKTAQQVSCLLFCLHWFSSSQYISLVRVEGQQDGGCVQSWKRKTCCQHQLEPSRKFIIFGNLVWLRWILYSRKPPGTPWEHGSKNPELHSQTPVLGRGENFGTKVHSRSGQEKMFKLCFLAQKKYVCLCFWLGVFLYVVLLITS